MKNFPQYAISSNHSRSFSHRSERCSSKSCKDYGIWMNIATKIDDSHPNQ